MWNMEYVVLKGEKLKEDCMTNEFVRMRVWELTMQITKSFQQEIGAFSTSFSLFSHST